jgi:mRNA interferase MazF
MHPARGEVWLFDLGMTAKTRPVVVMSIPYGDVDRAIVTVLRQGAFLVQGISTYPKAWAIRKLGVLNRQQMAAVAAGIEQWLGLKPAPSRS